MTDPGFAIPRRALVAAEPLGPRLGAVAAAAALAQGLRAGGAPAPQVLALDGSQDPRRTLEEHCFDARMLESRAVILLARRIDGVPPPGSAFAEMATRARQSGVPAYAVAREVELDAFGARVLDLQLVLQAGGAAGLRRAGLQLAGVL